MTHAPGSTRRRGLRRLGWTLAALLVVLVGAYLLRGPLFGGLLRGFVEARLGEALGARVTVERVDGNLFNEAEIVGIRAALLPGTLARFEAERARVEYGLGALLGGGAGAVRSVRVTGADVVLDLAAAPEPAARDVADATLAAFSVEGVLTLRFPAGEVRAQRFEAEGRLERGVVTIARVAATAGEARLAAAGVAHVADLTTCEATFEIDAPALGPLGRGFPDLPPVSGRAFASGTIRGSRGGITLDATVSGSDVFVDRIDVGRVEASIELAGRALKAREVKVASPYGRIVTRGDVTLGDAGAIGADVALDLYAPSIAKLGDFWDPFSRVKGIARASLRVTKPTEASWSESAWNGSVHADDVEVAKWILGCAEGQVGVAWPLVTVEDLLVDGPNGCADGRAVIDLAQGIVKAAAVDVDAEIDGDSVPLPDGARLRGLIGVSGRVQVQDADALGACVPDLTVKGRGLALSADGIRLRGDLAATVRGTLAAPEIAGEARIATDPPLSQGEAVLIGATGKGREKLAREGLPGAGLHALRHVLGDVAWEWFEDSAGRKALERLRGDDAPRAAGDRFFLRATPEQVAAGAGKSRLRVVVTP